jgi:hypothetical protein
LTFLGPADGDNLLLHPPGPPSDLEFGGHRVWLGPQSDWPATWPPPKTWESQPAASVRKISNNALEVKSPESAGCPSIRRVYRWERNGRLVCKSSWKEERPKGRQVIHILQMTEGTTVTAEPKKSELAPLGFVKLPLTNRPGIQTEFKAPPHGHRSGHQMTFRRLKTEEKFGLPVQTLVASKSDVELRFHPGKFRGVVTEFPDLGFLTQIYLGSDAWPVTEIEQLSPRLIPKNREEEVEFSVVVELIKKPARICK